MKYLNEQTLIPIGLAVIVIGGGSIWLTNLAIAVSHSGQMLNKIQTKQDRYSEDLHQIRLDLEKIKWKLGVKE